MYQKLFFTTVNINFLLFFTIIGTDIA